MLTDFGKALRIIRINRSINAREMASQLDISPSYLSAIENGTRSVPENLLSLILTKYKLTDYELEIINKSFESSGELKINIADLPDNKRRLLLSITNNNLSEEDIQEFFKKLEAK